MAAAALLIPVHSVAIDRLRLGVRHAGIDVNLESLGDAQVKVTVTNNADHSISVLKLNSIFDESPIQKVHVYKDGSHEELPFHGIQPRYDLDYITPDDFTPLAPGANISSQFDIAETLDLSSGGTYSISAQGVFLTSSDTNTSSITGVAPYKSNVLTLHLDASDISTRSPILLSRRADLSVDSCTNTPQGTILQTALRNAALLSRQSSVAARLGPASKFHEYFRTTSPHIRRSVSSRFAAIAHEASSLSKPSLTSKGGKGKVTYHCTDPFSYCRDGILAYAIPQQSIVVNCPMYYRLPDLTDRCHGQDQATTTLHEFTHASVVYAPNTVDFAYGYGASVALEPEEAVRNADSFALFANG